MNTVLYSVDAALYFDTEIIYCNSFWSPAVMSSSPAVHFEIENPGLDEPSLGVFVPPALV